ncbi:MAG: signal recognition particle-docking protein FtsY, partial [Deltaproteobacteria bacterium]|nr:signal recognition particle-docking protein FtsY [Deltaproteobacteria bacterium]
VLPLNVLIAACDTFRAAGKEQMEIWGEKIGIPVVTGKENQDPASVAHDASIMLKEKDFDVLIIDTAGRLHNKKHLMEELAKIKRTVSKAAGISPQETIIVIDASLGQNSIAQIEQFKELIDVSGIIITKLDGSAKGGIIIDAISKLNLPVRFIGTGEKIDDISEFSPEMFVDNIF